MDDPNDNNAGQLPGRVPMHDVLARKIELAKGGDGAAARWLIKQFCGTIERNRQTDADGKKVPHRKPSGLHTQFDERLLDYLSECLSRIGDFDANQKPVTADIALNITHRGTRGRKVAADTRAKSLRRGSMVWEASRAPGATLSPIFDLIAASEKQSRDTIERDYKAWLALIRTFEPPDETEPVDG